MARLLCALLISAAIAPAFQSADEAAEEDV
jgi:hypothetical protein